MNPQSKILCAKFPEVLQRVIMSFCEANIEYSDKLELCGSIHLKADGEKLLSFVIDDDAFHLSNRSSSSNENGQSCPSSGYNSYGTRALSVSSSDMEAVDMTGPLSPYIRRQCQQTRLYDPEKLARNRNPSSSSNLNLESPPNGDSEHLRLNNNHDQPLVIDEHVTSPSNHLSNEHSYDSHRYEAISPKQDVTNQEDLSSTNHENVQVKVEHTSPPGVITNQPSVDTIADILAANNNNIWKLPTLAPPYTFAGPFTSGTANLPVYPNPLTSLTQFPMNMLNMQQAMQTMQSNLMMPFGPISNQKIEPPRAKKQPSFVKTKRRVGNAAVNGSGVIRQTRRFGCPYCDATFANSQSMKNHINCQHTRSRKYPCTMCNKVFYSGGAVYLHLKRNHAGEKAPNTCKVCNKLFVNMTSFVRHVQFAHNLQACGGCGGVYQNLEVLEEHRISCTGKKDDGKTMADITPEMITETIVPAPSEDTSMQQIEEHILPQNN